eukprot:TRINITY_DN14476_c0_g1_i1.p1 TRINITY_DN14476_c0_g1~~TRINITY_DN14476_c0_g1_i1.p1  ORF type:complete len:139 (-),score=14.96 TRINITY_DN14476_c0_g1_i1:60-452(-)
MQEVRRFDDFIVQETVQDLLDDLSIYNEEASEALYRSGYHTVPDLLHASPTVEYLDSVGFNVHETNRIMDHLSGIREAHAVELKKSQEPSHETKITQQNARSHNHASWQHPVQILIDSWQWLHCETKKAD